MDNTAMGIRPFHTSGNKKNTRKLQRKGMKWKRTERKGKKKKRHVQQRGKEMGAK